MLWLPNGAGEALGDILATGPNLVTLGNTFVYYVGPTNASDSNNTGLEALRPLATLSAAVTSFSDDDDIIVLMDGFSQTLTANIEITEPMAVVGGGKSSGLATVRLTLNAAATVMLLLSGDDIEIRNVKFPAPAQSNTSPRISVTGTNILFKDCYFECDGNDAGPAVILLYDASSVRFEGCTFKVTSTSSASRPSSAIALNTDAAVARVDIHDCTFDGGTVGFSNTGASAGKFGHAVDFIAGTVTRFRGSGNSFIRGADIRFSEPESGSTLGWLQASTVSGGAFVKFP